MAASGFRAFVVIHTVALDLANADGSC